jgi:predicted RecA/RadA family phage recombinase
MDIVGDFNLRTGLVPHSGMTHQEFVQSTRPKDMYSSAGFGVGDVLRFALLSYTEGKAFELMRKAALALRHAKTEAEKKAIQARIEKELAALRGETIK